jgi:hypothetical protein
LQKHQPFELQILIFHKELIPKRKNLHFLTHNPVLSNFSNVKKRKEKKEKEKDCSIHDDSIKVY